MHPSPPPTRTHARTTKHTTTQSLHPLLPSLRPYSTQRAQRMVATSLSIAGVLYYTIAM